ncbi:MAG: IS1595 family transposase [Lachnospiraceae bacterium]|nr:IS1595 family transposase [Lachnospiraceae bacterium]
MADINSIWEQIKTLDISQKRQLRRMLGYVDGLGAIRDKQEFLTEKRFAQGRVCFECGSTHVVRHGKTADGIQRYRCRDCGKTFVITSNSILCRTRKSMETWQKYLECMMNGYSLRKSAKICNIRHMTAFHWRHKILDVLGQLMDRELSGIVEADETFFPLSYKGNHSKSRDFKMPRPAHHRGHEVKGPGLSKELVCVPCALNRSGQSLARVAKLGKVSINALHKVFDSRISKGSTICTDEDHAYRRFSREAELNLVQIQEHRTVKGIYNIQRINSFHSQLKVFMQRFHGVATKYLNNYLQWHCFMSDTSSTDEDKELFLTLLLFHTGKPERNVDIPGRPPVPVLA